MKPSTGSSTIDTLKVFMKRTIVMSQRFIASSWKVMLSGSFKGNAERHGGLVVSALDF